MYRDDLIKMVYITLNLWMLEGNAYIDYNSKPP